MPTNLSPTEKLKLLINSNSGLVAIDTVEEMRAMNAIREAAIALQLPLFEWSIADGLMRYEKPKPAAANAVPRPAPAAMTATAAQNVKAFFTGSGSPDDLLAALPSGPSPIMNTQDPAAMLAHISTMTIEAVFALKDLHKHLDKPVIVRQLRELAQEFSQDRRTLLLIGAGMALPAELESECEHLDLPLPDTLRLQQIVEETFARLGKKLTLKRKLGAADLPCIAANLRGLTEEEAERALSQAIVARYGLVPEVSTDVLEAKKEILRHTGTLEFVACDESMASIGGLENLKKWLARRQGTWDQRAQAAGLEAPKGVIILGVQGCGKSMCARAIAGEWKLPLVKFDTSAIYDKYVGETEKHIHKMFAVAEQLAPAVLWIDELEKVFAGSGPDSASVDAGVSARMLGAFLGWMQDRKAAVFVAATCNNVNALPPELIRKGRFDEIFFVDLPNGDERAAIFSVQLARHKQDAENFDLKTLVNQSRGFSGAEIEAAIKSAMYTAFADKKFLSTDVIVEELKSTVPLSTTRAEDIEELRQWAQTRAVQASYPEAAEAGA